MKKKNIFKKLLSVILSAATMFSLLTLPAHAIIPGEDAYGGESTIVKYDVGTNSTTPIDLPDFYSTFSGVPTHFYLSEEELAYTNNTNAMTPQTIFGSDDRIPVTNITGHYTGVVLIIHEIDTNEDNIADDYVAGTGFMVSDKVMVTAMHCLHNGHAGTNATTVETKIYQGVNVSAPSGFFFDEHGNIDPMPYLEVLPKEGYATIDSIIFDMNYFTNGFSNEYDWCVVTLDRELSGYHFSCAVPDSSIYNQTAIITGYPSSDSFKMYTGTGTVTAYSEIVLPRLFTVNTDATVGQSGSPVYIENGGIRTCYGVYSSDVPAFNYATKITTDVYNAIVQSINES